MSSKLRQLFLVGTMILGSVAMLPQPAYATFYTGSIDISDTCTGAGCTSGVRITLGSIDWFPPVGAPNGQFEVGSATGNLALLNGLDGFAKDLNGIDQPVGAVFPLSGGNANLAGEGVVLPAFLSFPLQGDVVFDLNFIQPAFSLFGTTLCGALPSIGQQCALSQFLMSNTSNATSSVSMNVNGFVRDVSNGDLVSFVGVYTTQFTVPYQKLLFDLGALNAGDPALAFYTTGAGCPTAPAVPCVPAGFVENTYSGTFTGTAIPIVPEPATLMLFGIGVSALAARRRRQMKNAR